MQKIALFGTSANPPGEHHREIVRAAAKVFGKVVVIPCGPRTDGKMTVNDIAPLHRAIMTDLAFRNLAPNVGVDLSDLECERFTRTYELERRYRKRYEPWHIVGMDLVFGGSEEIAHIQSWECGQELWQNANFAVVLREGVLFDQKDLPPHSVLIRPEHSGSSTEIRRKVFEHQSVTGLVSPEIETYIERFGLYRERKNFERVFVNIPEPRIIFFVNQHSEEAKRLYQEVRHLEDQENPNLVVTVGGDGTMTHAIRAHWRKRIPFLGVNAGHEGFLLNERAEHLTADFFKQEFILRSSPLLHVRILGADGSEQENLAVNDAWMQVEPGNTGWFEVHVDGRRKFSETDPVQGDGILVATAAGSTAYARTMGATPVHYSEGRLVLVGSHIIKPFSWKQGAHLHSEDAVVRIANADASGWRKLYGFADNLKFGRVSEMEIRLSRIASAHLLFTPQSDREKIDKYRFPKH